MFLQMYFINVYYIIQIIGVIVMTAVLGAEILL